MNRIVGNSDIVFITLDTLRFDVAQNAWRLGRTPNLAAILPESGWEQRHSPGSFTYSSHTAFFAGFLPTPAKPGLHPRLFALKFPGSETTTPDTAILDTDNIVTGLAQREYYTICIGGVGFFNKQTPLGQIFPNLFHESHWSPNLGVTDPKSTENQFQLAKDRLLAIPDNRRLFLFINISALHQPNCFYLEGSKADSPATQTAALEYVDKHIPTLFGCLKARSQGFAIICSDHGTAYGEDGYQGHRLAHPVVWNVPYTEFTWERMQ